MQSPSLLTPHALDRLFMICIKTFSATPLLRPILFFIRQSTTIQPVLVGERDEPLPHTRSSPPNPLFTRVTRSCDSTELG